MKKLTINQYARMIVKEEGGKKNLTIADILEVLAIQKRMMKKMPLLILGTLIVYAIKD